MLIFNFIIKNFPISAGEKEPSRPQHEKAVEKGTVEISLCDSDNSGEKTDGERLRYVSIKSETVFN